MHWSGNKDRSSNSKDMRNVLILVFLCCCLSMTGTTYYIDPSGNNSNNGLAGYPWKTLSFACSKATASGDIIHVNAGSYIETAECVLAVGVSIEGAGTSSWIKSHYAPARNDNVSPHAAITLVSSAENTNGNQSISNIKLDGDALTGTIGITVWRRGNVIIHDCSIVDFFIQGVSIEGFSDPLTLSTRATGNQFYNNIVTNCGDVSETWNGGGMLQIGGTTGLLIHDNIFTHNSRTIGHCGNIIQCHPFHQGTKIYNNKFYKRDHENDEWNFIIEAWSTSGGFEIYGNEFWGSHCSIDCGVKNNLGIGNTKGTYNYSYFIHNNLFTTADGNSIPRTVAGTNSCIDIEGVENSDIRIYYNHIKNLPIFVVSDNGTGLAYTVSNIYVCYNIHENAGWYNGVWDEFNTFHNESGSTLTNVYWYNNVLIGNGVTISTGIKIYNNSGTITNFNIKNNIFTGCNNSSFLNISNTSAFNGLHIDNNILFNNSSGNPVISGSAISNYDFSNNLMSDPLFVSAYDFRLQPGSPAIEKGVYFAGLTTDYAGNTVKNPPSIGAYESGATAQSPTPAIPVYQGSVINNATPSLLEIAYDMSLADIAPVANSFTVQVNSVARTVSSVTVSGAMVKLTLANRVVAGDIITVSYIKPAANPIQTTSDGIAASISNQQVVNDCINSPPMVKIMNPSKGIKFARFSSVTIDAIASDPDGVVSKVEFYNSTVKLIELTSAPYTYTWKNVVAGKYTITAIATDNLNDTTVSSPVEFEVGSIAKNDINSEMVKLYPNPNNGHFSIEFINPMQNNQSEIIITDLAGKQVYHGPVLKDETLKQIDLSDSRSGIYVMMIKEKEILVTKKFIRK